MNEQLQLNELLQKVEELKQSGTFDLSMEEDLSIAIMNLVSLEEHFFFTAEKTKKQEYFDLICETREIRKRLLTRMIPTHEGETWCITKHLLATTMRLIEVGTKLQADKKDEEAKQTFDDAYHMYSLFWMIRLKLISANELKNSNSTDTSKDLKVEEGWTKEDIISNLVDCCKE